MKERELTVSRRSNLLVTKPQNGLIAYIYLKGVEMTNEKARQCDGKRIMAVVRGERLLRDGLFRIKRLPIVTISAHGNKWTGLANEVDIQELT